MQPIHKFSYILRLWRVDQSQADWRSSLECPETGQRIGFASLEQLFAYLMELVEGNPDIPQTGGGGLEIVMHKKTSMPGSECNLRDRNTKQAILPRAKKHNAIRLPDTIKKPVSRGTN